MMGHGTFMGRMPVHGTPMSASTARMPMRSATTLNRASGFHRFNDFDRHNRFHHHFNRVIVIDNFGFPFFASFPFYYPYPYYPYGYYPYGYGYCQGYSGY
jgi:hypothetical protein